MSDDDDSRDTAAAAAAEVSDNWPEAIKGWTDQDRRTLIITIVGGLAANLGTVILVALAIAFVRLHQNGRNGYDVVAMVAGSLLGIAFGVYVLTRIPATSRVSGRLAGWLIIAMGWLIVVLALLILTGLASGVK